jgi:hypothetical protein
MQHYNDNTQTGVGDSSISTYWMPFHFYIKEKLQQLKIEHNYSDDYFNNFFLSTEVQGQLRKMFICNIIRWQMGRVLEVYLLLDRCIYLEENGHEVKLEQYFEESLSPRNLGILAFKNN